MGNQAHRQIRAGTRSKRVLRDKRINRKSDAAEADSPAMHPVTGQASLDSVAESVLQACFWIRRKRAIRSGSQTMLEECAWMAHEGSQQGQARRGADGRLVGRAAVSPALRRACADALEDRAIASPASMSAATSRRCCRTRSPMSPSTRCTAARRGRHLQGILEILAIPYTPFRRAGLRARHEEGHGQGRAAAPPACRCRRAWCVAGFEVGEKPPAAAALRDQADRRRLERRRLHRAEEQTIRRRSSTREDWAYGEQVMVERYIPGKELTCAVMGDEALGVIEIVPTATASTTYEAKYAPGGSKHLLPAPISPNVYQEVRQTGAGGASRARLPGREPRRLPLRRPRRERGLGLSRGQHPARHDAKRRWCPSWRPMRASRSMSWCAGWSRTHRSTVEPELQACARAPTPPARQRRFGRTWRPMALPLLRCAAVRRFARIGTARLALPLMAAGVGYGARHVASSPMAPSSDRRRASWRRDDARDAAANAGLPHRSRSRSPASVHLSREEMLAIAGVTGRDVAACSSTSSEARERLKANPWIADATVLKLYPGELQIGITEREAFALWQKDGRVVGHRRRRHGARTVRRAAHVAPAAGGRRGRRDAGQGVSGPARCAIRRCASRCAPPCWSASGAGTCG